MPQDHLPMVQREGSRQSRGDLPLRFLCRPAFFSDVNKQSHDAPSRPLMEAYVLCYSLICIGIAALWWFLGKKLLYPAPEKPQGWVRLSKTGQGKKRPDSSCDGPLIFATIHGIGHWLPKIMEASGMSPEKAGFIAAIPIATGIPSLLILPGIIPPGRRVNSLPWPLFSPCGHSSQLWRPLERSNWQH